MLTLWIIYKALSLNYNRELEDKKSISARYKETMYYFIAKYVKIGKIFSTEKKSKVTN